MSPVNVNVNTGGEPDPDDAHVTYTVKELLATIQLEQREGFTRLETAMDGKADSERVARLEERVDRHSDEIGALQEDLRGRARRSYTLKQVLAWVSGACVALGGIGAFLAAVHPFG